VRSYIFGFDCSGEYQTTLYTLNMCYPNTTTQSYVYSGYSSDADLDVISFTLTTYHSNNCTGKPTVSSVSYSTTCYEGGLFPRQYLYSDSFPITSGGIMLA
jgi:hypothetical protein